MISPTPPQKKRFTSSEYLIERVGVKSLFLTMRCEELQPIQLNGQATIKAG